jgi:single-strand DNA-binding protein
MLQKLTLIGNLGRDPEPLRYTASGEPVTSFSVATSERWMGRDNQLQERTTWWRVSFFGKQAETVTQYLKKGSKVYIEGRLTADPKTGGPRIWTGQDGAPRASFEVTGSLVRFLSPRGEGGAPAAANMSGGDHDVPVAEESEDIPF